MHNQIISNKKINVETLYQKITYFPNYHLIISSWYPHTRLMNNHDFFLELKKLFTRLEKTKSKNLLFIFNQFDFFISPTFLSSYIYPNPSFNKNNLIIKKIGVILPENNLVRISIEQTIENFHKCKDFELHIFNNLKQALIWLKN